MTTIKNKIRDIAEHTISEFFEEYEIIKTALSEGIYDASKYDVALSQLDDAKDAFIEKIEATIGNAETTLSQNPFPLARDIVNTLDQSIVDARGKFAIAFISLFTTLGLEDELDAMLTEEEPEQSYMSLSAA